MAKRKGVRIVVGYLLQGIADVWKHRSTWSLVLAATLMSIAISCPDLSASPLVIRPNATAGADVVLPHVNTFDSGFLTVLVVENSTKEAIAFGPSRVLPHNVRKFPLWGDEGVGSDVVTLPPGLNAYVEITTSSGRTFVVHPMEPIANNAIYQTYGMLDVTSGFSSFFAVFSPEIHTSGVVRCFQPSDGVTTADVKTVEYAFVAKPGTVALLECKGVGYLLGEVVVSAPAYVLPIRRNVTSGEWIVLPLRKPDAK